MNRRLWLALVPGHLFVAVWYALLALLVGLTRHENPTAFAVCYTALMAVLSVLNLYSWDYQRRRAGGRL